ncbi:uncharacterized protein LOC116843793 isoform X2 [Odontomachus brunneus]|uniref:uncharacterized protein LOC116843793 isoform X2 n=1 Tax=Odontomachus brunneus TaxID=486640 RepID=UPI0013F20042|nr:uncharacterized protein LOC116843793 isoform X2 [Odontomachus brunneus]
MNPDVMVAGPPPPPPPPPPTSGQLPTMRINTAESAATKRPQMGNNDAYEPPAAIQNAMLTKDKKPFTYTPGMGGKLDLSQIRSPRMARRVAKNANDEGIEGPPKSALESKPSPATPTTPNLYVQPQVAIPVFPTNVPPQPQVNRVSQPAAVNRMPLNAHQVDCSSPIVADKPAEAPKNITKIDTKIVPIAVTSSQSSTPESPNTPTQVTLAKAPTPWLQNKNKPQEELPEWAKRTSVNKAVASPLECPPSPTSPVYIQVQPPLRESPPQRAQVRPKEQEQQSAQYQPPPQYQTPQQKPQQSQQSPQQTQPTWQQKQNTDPAVSQRTNPQTHERIIPIRIEDRPSVFDAKREPGHHQFKQPPTLHHQQRWGQASGQSPESQMQSQPQDQEQPQTHVMVVSRPEQTVGTYIIPIVVEGNDKKTPQSNVGGSNATGRGPKVVQQRTPVPAQQHETGPVQSRSFRVLQKITDTDTSNDVGADQIRRMELSEDERVLMNKFKEQVDHETYLHQEEDPRYRGAAIPSRAFRFLQNMTDSTDASVTCAAPRNPQNVANKKQNRNSKSFEETQANLPPSEQQVPEPKKYMGSAIPSRSFRILQAMTAPESIATQENRQADYTRRTENNLPGNQQGVFLPPPPVPFWYPEGWWGYYPAVQYNVPFSEPADDEANKHSFPPYACPDGNVYVGYEPFYPLYDQNLADLARVKVTRRESLSSTGQNKPVYSEPDRNGHHQQSHMDANAYDDHDRLSATDSSFAQKDRRLMRSDLPDDESNGTVLPEEINHLDAQSSGTHGPKCHQRGGVGENGDVDRNGIVTAMNIIDEEGGLPDSHENTAASASSDNAELEKTFGLHINVPNYTYVDTSDSSDSSDDDDSSSDDSTSDNEQLSDSRRKSSSRRDDTTSSNNSSSDSDSDSYMAYSTGLNPHEKPDKESRGSAGFSEDNRADLAAARSECTTSAENRDSSVDDSESADKSRFRKDRPQYSDDFGSQKTSEQNSIATARYNEDHLNGRGRSEDFLESDKTNPNDHESDVKQATIVPRLLNVINNDTDRQDSESPCYEDRDNGQDVNGQEKEAAFEATDDPPDDSEPTMVSVSLPLRFKFFVSENNEDITTVIVGDSKIRAEKPRDLKSGQSVENYEVNDDDDDDDEDVSVNFHVGNDTSVDFTIKRHASTDDTRNAMKGDAEDSRIEVTIPQVNFTLRKDRSRTYESSREEHAETESTATTTELDKMSSAGSTSSDDDDHIVESTTPARDVLLKDKNHVDVIDSVRDDLEPRVLAESESSLTQDDLETPQVRVIDTSCNSEMDENNSRITRDKEEDSYINPEVNQTTSETKRLLSVQDSREDTDEDEDSGVTSDLSRMISEVDTDSECTSSKNSKKYQRTQTHSRLFRLLNDDSIQESPSDYKMNASSRKEYLSLPLNTNTVFNYDDSYCSNYSSGLTSPEYSPIHEQSWRRFHDASLTNGSQNPVRNTDHAPSQSEQVIPPLHKDDPYFRTWKNPRPANLHNDVVPSLAYKILDSKMPSWAYKVNVLCPRIKSTKSVPRALKEARTPQTAPQRPGKINDPPPTVLPIPSTSCASANANYC